MAGPTTGISRGPVPYATGSGLGHHSVIGLEVNSSTFKNGACLIDGGATTGTVTESTAPLNATNHVLGVSLADASGKATGQPVPYVMVLVGQLWEITLSTVSSSHTLVQTDLLQIWQVTRDTNTGKWYLDTSLGAVTSNLGFLVLWARDAIGTVDARVVGHFLAGVLGTTQTVVPTGVALNVYA